MRRLLALVLGIVLVAACGDAAPQSIEILVDSPNPAGPIGVPRDAHLLFSLYDAQHRRTRADGYLHVWLETTRGDRGSARCEMIEQVHPEQILTTDRSFIITMLPPQCAEVPAGLPPLVVEATFEVRNGVTIQGFGSASRSLGGTELTDTGEPAPPRVAAPAPRTGPSCDRRREFGTCTSYGAGFNGSVTDAQERCARAAGGGGVWSDDGCPDEGVIGRCTQGAGSFEAGAVIYDYPLGPDALPGPPRTHDELRAACVGGYSGVYVPVAP
jgi:hypothetical protein